MQLKNLTPIQIKLYNDFQHRFIIVPAGRRSRKTLIAMRKVLMLAMLNENKRYFFGAPTYRQAKEIFWKRLKDWTVLFRKYCSETELKVILQNDTELCVIGLDKPERIEGQEWHGCHITEFANVKEGAWEENIRPVLSDTLGFAFLDSVPQGRNHYYEKALYACDQALPVTELGKGSFCESKADPEWCYYHWFSADVLSPIEMESVKRQLDERTFRQEYLGSFESYEGLAYYAFSEKNFSNCTYNSRKTVHIGMDFNVDPMTAVFCHIEADNVYQFGEAFLKQSNTFEMRDHILNKFGTVNVVIYPDSTGRAEESNASQSDIAILEKAGFRIRAHPSNPYIVDRVNSVNSKISSGGNCHYFINPESCPKTLNDFNKVERLPDGRLDKSQEKDDIKHITDALGYFISYMWPVRERKFGGVKR